MKNVLFLCSRNRLRSPTAEHTFRDWPGILVESAGLAPDADNPVTSELVAWSDIIFVMTKEHRTRLSRKFRAHMKAARVICLDIPDDYEAMQPELIEILLARVTPHLPRTARGR